MILRLLPWIAFIALNTAQAVGVARVVNYAAITSYDINSQSWAIEFLTSKDIPVSSLSIAGEMQGRENFTSDLLMSFALIEQTRYRQEKKQTDVNTWQLSQKAREDYLAKVKELGKKEVDKLKAHRTEVLKALSPQRLEELETFLGMHLFARETLNEFVPECILGAKELEEYARNSGEAEYLILSRPDTDLGKKELSNIRLSLCKSGKKRLPKGVELRYGMPADLISIIGPLKSGECSKIWASNGSLKMVYVVRKTLDERVQGMRASLSEEHRNAQKWTLLERLKSVSYLR